MGRKLKDLSNLSEPEAQETPNLRETKAERKKKKQKNKDQEEKCQLTQLSPKRKLEEIAPQEQNTDSNKKKNKKHKKSKDKEQETENNVKEPQRNGDADEGESREQVVVVTGKDANEAKYKSLNSFAEAKLPSEVLRCCENFKSPSPIQSRAWPFLLDGRDFIGIAKTGSGKTLAFGVPAIMHVLNKRKGKFSKGRTPLCLALAPTRELAQQISDVLFEAGKPCGVISVCLYGGASKGPQISSLKSGVDIVIGTPGRLKDLIEMGVCSLKEVSFTVLDEADRMLDMGFEPEVRFILGQTCSERQMVMFSATWPPSVHQLAQEFMDPNPVKVVVGSEDLAANHDVMQIVEVLDDHSRDGRLVTLLEKYHKTQENRVLVFVLYKMEATRVENMLTKGGWKVVSIHGDKAQTERTKALSLFKKGSCPLMIATDVAARGLDIPDVEVVINYSFPLTTEDYVHRIGRTGRAGKKGVAHTFFTHHNKALAGELVNVLREAKQNVPEALLKFGTHVKKKESKLYGAHFREIPVDAPKSKKITFDNSDDEN
ncbi:DEAD-box ATP-dependent RNA helicase 5 isoform X2 [Prunus yedoensis var. nudiflora]|uniref:RNA helicase n=1 Tax=Prunus yedoensis var. nudiflora TaxID=2094558 RepID=A0A314UXG2_PRUYE|nr:DEAD-box ATP-dependent RNA helicase 5 isoform X2 [Prunus yedoensis var. nudiflora]